MSYYIAQDYKYLGNDRWSWQVWIDASTRELDQVKQVTWYLHPTFSQPVVIKKNRDKKFILKTSGWGVFQIRAELSLTDGSKKSLSHWLQLAYPNDNTEVTAKGKLDTIDKKNNKVFLSYGAEDQKLAVELRVKLEERGYEILDPNTIESNVPFQAATNKMIRDSDLMLGIITSDLTSPTILRELNAAKNSQKPALAVINQGIANPSGLNQDLNRLDINLNSSSSGDKIADVLGKIIL